jgi:hypothetical protein
MIIISIFCGIIGGGGGTLITNQYYQSVKPTPPNEIVQKSFLDSLEERVKKLEDHRFYDKIDRQQYNRYLENQIIKKQNIY